MSVAMATIGVFIQWSIFIMNDDFDPILSKLHKIINVDFRKKNSKESCAHHLIAHLINYHYSYVIHVHDIMTRSFRAQNGNFYIGYARKTSH